MGGPLPLFALLALSALLVSVRAQAPTIPPAPPRVPSACANINALFDSIDGIASVCSDDDEGCSMQCAAAAVPLVERCGDVIQKLLPDGSASALHDLHDSCAAAVTPVSELGPLSLSIRASPLRVRPSHLCASYRSPSLRTLFCADGRARGAEAACGRRSMYGARPGGCRQHGGLRAAVRGRARQVCRAHRCRALLQRRLLRYVHKRGAVRPQLQPLRRWQAPCPGRPRDVLARDLPNRSAARDRRVLRSR